MLCSKTEANRQREMDGMQTEMYERDKIDKKT